MARGVVQPRPVVEKLITQVEGLAVAEPQKSVFWGPVQAMPDSFSAAERERLTAAYRAAVGGQITPAYARLGRFLREEYLPKARSSVAWTALPDGPAWYYFYVQEHTTTDLTPEEIHEIGLREVARILGEMDGVRRKVGFDGDLRAFFEHLKTDPRYFYTRGEDLVQGYRELKKRIDAEIPRLFSVLPKADYEVREVEAFRAQSSAGAFYQRALGRRIPPRRLLRQHLQPAGAAEVRHGDAVAARSLAGTPLPGDHPAGTAGDAAVPALRR